jgi:CubicO group peptidase (beta-lactamase class C family)
MKNIGEEYIEYWSKKYKKGDWLTVGEYFDFFKGFFISTTNYMGFKVESNVEEGWLYLKIYDDNVSQRILQFENSLAPQMVIKGDKINYYNIYDRIKHYNVPGVSIALINDGKIEWAKGYGYFSNDNLHKIDTNTLFQAASISKPVTALAALQLVEKGQLDLDRNINDFLKSWQIPENKFAKQKYVTARMILSHTGGLTVQGFDEVYNSDEKMPTVTEILEGKPPAKSKPVIVDTLPGSSWRYSGGGYTVMQLAIMDITNNDFADYLNKTVLSPLGMNNSTFEVPLPDKYYSNVSNGNDHNGAIVKNKWGNYPQSAAAGLWATPSDLARFAIEIQNSYKGKSNKIISRRMTHEMLTKNLGSWGLGFNVDGKSDSLSFSHGGSHYGYNCEMFAFANLGKGIVIMTNSDNGEKLINEILRSAAIVYKWSKFTPTERTVIEMDTSSLKKYTGTYQVQPGAEVEITLKGITLYGQNSWDHYSYPIYPESETKFFEITLPLEINFDIDQNKEVLGFDGKNMDKEYYCKKIK